MPPLVSIVIPCFNHGKYLQDAIQSVEKNRSSHICEIVIVNDGSTDAETLDTFSDLENKGYNVVHQFNQGLAAARNQGINTARGQYIIPLDSDNKLHANYLNKGIDILINNPDIDIVYGNSAFFGECEPFLNRTGPLNFGKLVEENYIDACAIIRKDLWLAVGGYDINMVMGFEDWEFWIKAFLKGGKFFYMNDTGFYYRIRPDSMLRTLTAANAPDIKSYIYKKHHRALIQVLCTEAKIYKGSADYVKTHKIKTIVKLLLGQKI